MPLGALALLWLLVAIGLLSLFIPAAARLLSAGWSAGLTVLAVGLFLAGASTVTGSLVGFLFRVPRYRTDSNGQAQVNASVTPATLPNTNLEQISDWLTKIIVGVGLTQLPAIGGFFGRLGERWGGAFGDAPAGPIIAISITIHYLVVGFFQGFLLSSLWLPSAMKRAIDDEARSERDQDEKRTAGANRDLTSPVQSSETPEYHSG
jgi:hypothetical protein